MSATLSQLQARATSKLGEPTQNLGGGFIQPSDLTDWANEAIRILNKGTRYLTAESIATPLEGYLGTTIPTDMIDKWAMYYAEYDGDPLVIYTEKDVIDSFYKPRTQTGTPWAIYEAQGTHFLYELIASGAAVTNGLIRRYVKKHTDLSAGSDTSPLPDDLDPAIVAYMVWQGKQKRGFPDAPQADQFWQQLYGKAVKEYRPVGTNQEVTRKRVSPASMVWNSVWRASGAAVDPS